MMEGGAATYEPLSHGDANSFASLVLTDGLYTAVKTEATRSHTEWESVQLPEC